MRAVCPQLHGHWLPKLALLLVLLGGVPQTDARGTHLRGTVHMLLLGDTATGDGCMHSSWHCCCMLSNAFEA